MFLLLSRTMIVKNCNLKIYTHTYTHVPIYVKLIESRNLEEKKRHVTIREKDWV